LWCSSLFFFTPPEATSTGLGFNRGSGAAAPGGVAGAYAHTGGIVSYSPRPLSVYVSPLKWQFTFFPPIFKHTQHTQPPPTLPLGDTPNTRALPQTLALSAGLKRC